MEIVKVAFLICFLAGIVLLVRGIACFREPVRSKKWIFWGGAALFVPMIVFLVKLIMDKVTPFPLAILFFEAVLAAIFLWTRFGNFSDRGARNTLVGFSAFFLLQLYVVSLIFGLFSSGSGDSYYKHSGNFLYRPNTVGVAITNYSGDEERVEIPAVIDDQQVTQIDRSAFSYDDSVTDIVIPESVTTIDQEAFRDCDSLTGITIPGNVTSIGANAFGNCTSLTSIYVDSRNTKYASKLGVLYSKDGTTLIAYPAGRSGSVQVPDTVRTISDYAFTGCSKMVAVTIPDSVTEIGTNAFQKCSSLVSISIPDGVTSIETSTFEECTALSDVVLPDTITSIGSDAFAQCQSLTEIALPADLWSIGESAFFWCFSLETITIPDNVSIISRYVFTDCRALTEIKVSPGNSDFSSEAGILYDIEKKHPICCPAGMHGAVVLADGATYVDEYVFSACREVTDITLPDSVTRIGREAFADCNSLKSITIPDSVTSIDATAFPDTKDLVIYCRQDSYAKSFAEENGIKVELIA